MTKAELMLPSYKTKEENDMNIEVALLINPELSKTIVIFLPKTSIFKRKNS